jgi:hypothetical protein
VPVNEFSHKIECTVFALEPHAHGEGRAERVEHRCHLVANVTEVMGSVNRGDQICMRSKVSSAMHSKT